MRYSFKLLLIIFLWTLPVSLLVFLAGLFDPEGKRVYSLGRLWAWGFLKIGGVRLKTRGLDRLPLGRPYIFMANHQSNFDIPLLVQSLPAFQLRWVAKRELLYIPFFGWALWASKHIVVDRSSRRDAVASLKKARQRIANGISVVFFPEGTRNSRDEFLPFKRGGFLLAMKTQTPIVPVTINGSGRIWPKGNWRIRGGEVEVVVGEPVSVDRYAAGRLQDLVSDVRTVMEANACPQSRAVLMEAKAASSVAGERTLSER